MKKIIAMLLALVMLVFTLASCGKEIIGLVPLYVGEDVYDENHEFKAEDFSVWVVYEESQVITKDFKFEVLGINDGAYVIEVSYKDWTNVTYVDIKTESDTTAE